MNATQYTISLPAKIGVIGTGFISRGFCHFIETQADFEITGILTRREIKSIEGFSDLSKMTNSLEQLLSNAEIIVELSGGLAYTSQNVKAAHISNLPVVTLNTDFHVTYGSQHVNTGFLTEAEGDQPGCMAALNEEIVNMGFNPIVYGNIKGYLNHNPSLSDMTYWAERQGISLDQVVAATDGTKIQSEMALIANGLGATIAKQGLIGHITDNLDDGAQYLANEASKLAKPISDYLLSDPTSEKKLPKGIFIVATHDQYHHDMLDYYKLGSGPYYIFHKPYYLPHLEIIKTLRKLINGTIKSFNNSDKPTITVAAVAKTDLAKGELISKGIGSFQVRGEAIIVDNKRPVLSIGKISNIRLPWKTKKNDLLKNHK